MGSGHKIKNLLCHSCLAQQQLLKMVWHDLVAPTTMDLLHFREKDRVQARAYLGGLGRITTQPKITADQPSMPWKFQLNLFTCLKVIHDFQCHRQMDRHANSIQNESPLYPIWVQADFFLPCYFYLTPKRHERAIRWDIFSIGQIFDSRCKAKFFIKIHRNLN